MLTEQHTVSVIIPNYSRVRSLDIALQSLKNQTFKAHEIIIIDDNSENISEIYNVIDKHHKYLNIVFIKNDRNMGANHCRNIGINVSKCRFIAFLDSDDLWMPTKLQKQLEAITTHVGLNAPVLCATGRYRTSQDGTIIAVQSCGQELTDSIYYSNTIGTISSVLVDTASARKIGGFNETLKACQDWDFYIRLKDRVKYIGIMSPLCIYVDHTSRRISDNKKEKILSFQYIYDTHLRNIGIDPRRMESFYLNLAELNQDSGNYKEFKKYYSKYIESKYYSECFFSMKGIIKNIEKIKIPFSIRNNRYKNYIKSMDRKVSRGLIKDISFDQNYIKDLIKI